MKKNKKWRLKVCSLLSRYHFPWWWASPRFLAARSSLYLLAGVKQQKTPENVEVNVPSTSHQRSRCVAVMEPVCVRVYNPYVKRKLRRMERKLPLARWVTRVEDGGRLFLAASDRPLMRRMLNVYLSLSLVLILITAVARVSSLPIGLLMPPLASCLALSYASINPHLDCRSIHWCMLGRKHSMPGPDLD